MEKESARRADTALDTRRSFRNDSADPVPDGDELVDARWFNPAAVPRDDLNGLASALLRDAGYG